MSKQNTLIAERMSLIKPSPTMAVTKMAAEMKAAGKDIIGLAQGNLILILRSIYRMRL